MDLRRSRSLGLTHGFPLPSLSTFNTLYVDYSLVLGLAVFFYVSCHPLRHSHSHSRIQSPILFFSHPRTPFSFRLCFPPYFGRTEVDPVVITLRTRTNPPLLRPCFHSPIAVVLKHFIYPLRKAPYIPFCRVTVLVPHTSSLSSYLPLLPVLSGEGEHGGRGRRVLLMYGLEIALAKSINSCSYLACERVNFGECCVAN